MQFLYFDNPLHNSLDNLLDWYLYNLLDDFFDFDYPINNLLDLNDPVNRHLNNLLDFDNNLNRSVNVNDISDFVHLLDLFSRFHNFLDNYYLFDWHLDYPLDDSIHRYFYYLFDDLLNWHFDCLLDDFLNKNLNRYLNNLFNYLRYLHFDDLFDCFFDYSLDRDLDDLLYGNLDYLLYDFFDNDFLFEDEFGWYFP